MQKTSHSKHHLPINNMLYNIHFLKLCTLELMHHSSGLLFCNIDDALRIKSHFMPPNFHENEWTKPWAPQTYEHCLCHNIFKFFVVVVVQHLYHWKETGIEIIFEFNTVYPKHWTLSLYNIYVHMHINIRFFKCINKLIKIRVQFSLAYWVY